MIQEYYQRNSNALLISPGSFVTTWIRVMRKLSFSRNSASKEGVVSVVIPTYNDIEYLQRAIDSVISQTYGKIEIIIVDSSEDRRAQHLINSSENTRYIHQEPEGPAAARNAGIEASKGEFVAFLDADDEWLPTKLERQVDALTESNASFCFCDEYCIRNRNTFYTPCFEPTGDKDYIRYFKKGGHIGSRTVLVRRNCLKKHCFDESLSAREDPNLWVRLLRDCELKKINEPLAIKHIRDDSLTSDFEMVYRQECQSIHDLCDQYPELRQHKDERLWTAKWKYLKRLTINGESNHIVEILGLCTERFDVRAFFLLTIAFLPPSHRRPLLRIVRKVLNLRHKEGRLAPF